jgi:hypothetical protein
MIDKLYYKSVPLLLILAFAITMISCEKTMSESSRIDITLENTEVYHLELGTFGDEEGPSIIEDAQHALSSKILGKLWEFRIYEYIPDSNYTGHDFVKIKTERGSDGASPNDKIEIISINFKIIE